MTTETITHEVRPTTKVVHHTSNGAGGAIYGLGMIGAWVYYIGQAATFWLGVLGFLKGIVWPAFMVYTLMQYLHM